ERPRGVVARIHERDRAPGADRDALEAPDAISDETGSAEEVPLRDHDAVRDADVGTGVARDLLGAAKDRVDAPLRRRRIESDRRSRMRAQHRMDAEPL